MDRRYPVPRLLSIVLVVLLASGLAACGDSESSDTTLATASVNLAVYADVVWGPLNVSDDLAATTVCVNDNLFPKNSEIVWRARVTDPVTGTELGDEALTVSLALGDGQVFDMRYGSHPRENPTDFFWTASFDIPIDYPSGTLSYTINATATDGRTGSFVPFNVAPSLLRITDDVLETIAES